jgi:hypothetical protein
MAMCSPDAAQRKQERKSFFSQEKKQETFISLALSHDQAMSGIYPRAPEVKVFCFFFSEKKTLPSFGIS